MARVVPGLLFVGLAVFFNYGPYRAQIDGKGTSVFVWSWELFTSSGKDICDLRYYTRDSAGEDTPVERWSVLGVSRPGELPDEQARVHADRLDGHHREICRRLKEQASADLDLRAEIRCGHRGWWRNHEKRERNLCAPGALGKDEPERKRATPDAEPTDE